MQTDTTISDLIAKLGRFDPVPGVGGGDAGYRPLDEGEVAAATLVACGEAAIPALIEATRSDNWVVRYRSVDALGILGSEKAVQTLVGLLRDENWQVRQSAMLALLGDVVEEQSTSYPDHSAIIEYCHRALRFDVLTLFVQHGSTEIKDNANRLLRQGQKQGGPLAQRTVLETGLSYAAKKRSLEALRVDVEQVCNEIERTGTEQDKRSAAQFLHEWKNENQLVRAGKAPVNSFEELLRGAGCSPTYEGRRVLVRGADTPENEAHSVPAPQPGWRDGVFRALSRVSGRMRRAEVVGAKSLASGDAVVSSLSAPAVVAPSALPAPALELYARRTRALCPIAGMEMILIPAGEFIMGSNDRDNEKPVHKVFLDSYYIMKTPVTVKQYKTFCTATGRALPKKPHWGWKADHPMVRVSWEDAVAFCAWAGIQLPTEAQWEKAARGTDGREYPWGNGWDASRCVNSVSDRVESPMWVGSYPQGASPYGVLDMSGNVWDWCADWYDEGYYQASPYQNPAGPANGQFRVLRGGSWGYLNQSVFRCAARGGNLPAFRGDNIGFRCCAPGLQ
jgi:sulfatase modifying factor 1